MNALWQDIRFSLRLLRSKPWFTLAALAMLGLGIGAATVILSIVNTVLLAPLSLPQADRLMRVEERHPGWSSANFTYANYADLARSTRTLHEVAAYRPWPFNLSGGAEPESVGGYMVTPNFFPSVGVAPFLGRNFTAEENQAGNSSEVILSHGLWRRRYGSDQNIIGKTCTLNGSAARIVGVMPDGFRFPLDAALWVPLAPSEELIRNRRAHLFSVIGRMNSGTTPGMVRAELRTLSASIDGENRGVDPDWLAYALSVREGLTARVRLPLLLFLGAVGLLLILVCVNVANLQLVRAIGRKKELGVRIALGVSKPRLLRLVLVENVLLAVAGGALSLWIANLGLKLIVRFGPRDIPRLEGVHLDARVLCTVLVLTVFVGVFFGLAPAHQAFRTDARDGLQESRRSSSSAWETYTFRLLIVAEVGLSLVLLIGAGLLTNSFVRLLHVPLGFEPNHVLTIQMFSPDVTESEADPRVLQKWHELLERVRAIPGVKTAGLVNSLPIEGGVGTDFAIEGRPPFRAEDEPSASIRIIDPLYLETMQIPVLSGRRFDQRDSAAAPKVMLINRTMANTYWPGENPVGKRVTMKDWGPPLTGEIVGVVGDVKQDGPDLDVGPMIYWPFPQFPSSFNYVVIRTTGNPVDVVGVVKHAIWSLDSERPLTQIRSMEQVLGESLAQRKFSLFLAGCFALISLLLAAIGIAGVMSFITAQRTRELGIRSALGAQKCDILHLVLGQGVRLILLGTFSGVVVALLATSLLTNMLYGIKSKDPLTFLLAIGVIAIAALIACYGPARAATRVDPMVALRYE
jgi:putative ABC transport system permease protein